MKSAVGCATSGPGPAQAGEWCLGNPATRSRAILVAVLFDFSFADPSAPGASMSVLVWASLAFEFGLFPRGLTRTCGEPHYEMNTRRDLWIGHTEALEECRNMQAEPPLGLGVVYRTARLRTIRDLRPYSELGMPAFPFSQLSAPSGGEG